MKTNYSWLEKISPALRDLDMIPLLGHAPAIDWETICQTLEQNFELKDINITFRETAWKASEEIGRDFGSQTNIVPLHITPLEGHLFWVMSNRDIQKLSCWVLTKEKQSPALQTMNLQEGFYRYLTLEALDAIFSHPPLNHLTPQIAPLTTSKEEMLCFDVEIEHGEEVCIGRLAMSASMQKSWRKHFYAEDQTYLSEKFASKLDLPLSIVVGNVALDYTSLEAICPGDFVVLDRASYDPRSHQGNVALMLGNEHLFQVILKQNKIKLLEKDLQLKQEAAMDNLPPEEEMNPEQPPQEPTQQPPQAEDMQEMPEASQEKSINLKQLPLNVTVEIARFSMPLSKLTKLEPGNMLELPVHPDQGVDLLINGKKIGRGELVHLGDALGVRVLEFSGK